MYSAILREGAVLEFSLVKSNYFEMEKAAVQHNPMAFRFAHSDSQLAMLGAEEATALLEFAGDTVRASFDHIYAAVRNNNKAIAFGSKEVVLQIMDVAGADLIKEAGPHRDDLDVCIAAVRKDPHLVAELPPDMANRIEVARACIETNGLSLRWLPKSFLMHREIVLAAIRSDPESYFVLRGDHAHHLTRNEGIAGGARAHSTAGSAGKGGTGRGDHEPHEVFPSLVHDQEVVIAAVKGNGRLLQFVPADMQGDKEIVVVAVQQDGRALEFASKDLRNDAAVVEVAMKHNETSLQFAESDRVLEWLQKDGLLLRYVRDDLTGDHALLRAALRQNPKAKAFVPFELQSILPEIFDGL